MEKILPRTDKQSPAANQITYYVPRHANKALKRYQEPLKEAHPPQQPTPTTTTSTRAKPTEHPPHIRSTNTLQHLREFNKKYLGMEDYDETAAKLGELIYNNLTLSHNSTYQIKPSWMRAVPTRHELWRSPFGRPDKNHSFTQESCLETTLVLVLRSGFADPTDLITICELHPLINHLTTNMATLSTYNFTWVRDYNPNWEKQKQIDPDRQLAFTAGLLHFNLDVSLLVRYLGNNYTGEYREVQQVVTKLRHLNIDDDLIKKYVRVMASGCPNYFNAETSRSNAILYWRKGNGETISQKLAQVEHTMNKEEKNAFVIPLPVWLARYTPHLFFTPQHILEKPGKKDRQIFDASKRHTPDAIPVNMMTSTRLGTEEECTFGDVRERIYKRLYNLRITYPEHDLVIHANDVKSAFRQLKLHPDIVGAFSFIISQRLFLSCGLPFGTDFSPANWEVIRRLLEAVAEALFDDESLCIKHAEHIKRMQFDRALGKIKPHTFAPAIADDLNPGVPIVAGQPPHTPHAYYVDDGIYVDIYDEKRVQQAIAASIEAIFLLLGDSDLRRRQDPVSFDKMTELLVSYRNRILGETINTRALTTSTPRDFIEEVLKSLQTTWGIHRKRFYTSQAAELAGKLQHIARTALWLKHLITHVYVSLATALRMNSAHLIRTSKSFRQGMKQIANASTEKARTFYQAQNAQQVHRCKQQHNIIRTLRQELDFIRQALSDSSVQTSCPIAHLIPRVPFATAYSDASLLGAGGYCPNLNFWWYLEWNREIRQRTLPQLKDNKTRTLIDINVLEYAGIIITYAASCYCIHQEQPNLLPTHPVILCQGDNTASESWATKGSKHSPGGRALGRLQCALMINNPIAIKTAHISTHDNIIADELSRIPTESHTSLHYARIKQAHPVLAGCRRFIPSSDLTFAITAAILRAECTDPVAVSKQIQAKPGKIITSDGANP